MPTAVIRFDNVNFPVSFYLSVMEEMRRAYRATLVATIPARIEEAKADWRAFERATPEWDGSGHLLTIEDIEESAAKLFADRSGFGPQLAGEVTVGNATWRLPLEELFSELRKPYDQASFKLDSGQHWRMSVATIEVRTSFHTTEVTITADTRAEAQKYADMFSDAAPLHAAPAPEREQPRIFIGHGRNTQWRELSDYLHHQMGFKVEAFETLPRAGHTIKEVLDAAMVNNNVAILVMTAEDEQADAANSMRARQNVVHETGLFQGHLGFHRTIVLLEEGTEDFSNLAGLQELRYPAGQIRATFGDIIATLQREFPT